MIASDRFARRTRQHDVAGSTLARVPQRSFGDTSWITLALQSCVQHLTPAIQSGVPSRIANAVRAIAHAPTAEQVDDVLGATCDTLLSEAYAARDSRLISNVAKARTVIETVVGELRDRNQREAIDPGHLRETVDTYVRIVALSDRRAAQRFDAVGHLAARIGSAMHLSPPTLLEVELAGRMHDIGTLAIPESTYSPQAFEEHSTVGEAFLNGVPSLAFLAPIVRSHHERFDGKGYPDGLAGEEIPVASRIISVAAAFVDLITESPAHEAVLPNTACRKLAAAAGTQFDPRVVTATLRLLQFRQRTNRSA
jgi:HD-GYP domain-containing protein (c-di-GMP phosphodiesterase class II)